MAAMKSSSWTGWALPMLTTRKGATGLIESQGATAWPATGTQGISRVIASTNPSRMFTHFALQKKNGQDKGSYYDRNGAIVAFARTLGYEDYDGLGWHGVVVQETESDERLAAQLDLEKTV